MGGESSAGRGSRRESARTAPARRSLPPDGERSWQRIKKKWQEVDAQLNCGACSADETADILITAGLARRVSGPLSPASLPAIWTIELARGPNLVPGPLLLVTFPDRAYGGPRLYRPVGDELRRDTGALGF